jgi:hypothetical protein
MNKSILNGSDTSIGGSIIIPIDIRILDMIISTIKNGMNKKNPIINPVLSSLITKAGITM